MRKSNFKITEKILAFVLAMVMVIGMVPVSAFAAEGDTTTPPTTTEDPTTATESTEEASEEVTEESTEAATEEATEESTEAATEAPTEPVPETVTITFNSMGGEAEFTEVDGSPIGVETSSVTISYGESYSFRVEKPVDYAAQVTEDINFSLLYPDVDGVYTISNVRKDCQVIGMVASAVSSVTESDYSKDAVTVTVNVGNFASDTHSVTYTDASGASAEATTIQTGVTYSFQVTENGEYTITLKYENGSEVASVTHTVTHIDRELPVVTQKSKTDWTNDTTVVISATDVGSGVDTVYYKDGKDTKTAERNGDGDYVFTVNMGKDKVVERTYEVYAVDNAGNESEHKEIAVKIDTKAPTLSSAWYDTNAEGYAGYEDGYYCFNKEVHIKVYASDDTALTIQYQYAEDESKLTESGWVTKGEGDYTQSEEHGWPCYSLEVTPDGEYTGRLYVRVVDAAGNTSKNTKEVGKLKFDGSFPKVTITKTEDGTDSAYVSGEWTRGDVTVTLTGGDVEGDGVLSYQYNDGTGWKTMTGGKLVINYDTNATYQFRAIETTTETGTDGTATDSIKEGTSISYDIYVRKTAPVNAVLKVNGEAFTDDIWYTADEKGKRPEFTFDLSGNSESPIGITYSYQITKIDGTTVLEEGEIKTGVEALRISKEDGEYKIIFWAEDAVGNTSGKTTYTVKVDTTEPTDLTINAVGKEQAGSDKGDIPLNDVSGVFHSITSIELSAVFGKNDASGEDGIYYIISDTEIEKFENTTEGWTKYDGAIQDIFDDGLFYLYVKAVDVAGNAVYAKSGRIVLDSIAPTFTVTNEGDIKAKIHNTDVTLNVDVVEELNENVASGIAGVYYQIFTDESGKGEIPVDGWNEKDQITSWKEVVMSGSILTEIEEGYIPVKDQNSNNIFVAIKAVDTVGNASTYVVGPIKIDTTDPEVAVTFAGDDADATYPTFYNDNRTATITVKERNFDAENWNKLITLALGGNENAIENITWTKQEAAEGDASNGDDSKYVATIVYSVDGDYTLEVTSVMDLAGNAAIESTMKNDKDEDVRFYTAFTIDKTAPTVSVAYDNNDVQNEKYFKAQRTATITIVEHNYDQNRTIINLTAALDGEEIEKPEIVWAHNGDTHTATIVYEADGDYTFTISVTDKAGNTNAGVNYGESVATNEFTVDQTIVTPTISGVENGKGYKDTVIPGVSFEDLNFQDYEITLTRTQMNDKNVDVTEQFIKGLEAGERGGEASFDYFTESDTTGDLDGIYVLTVKMTDKAGNEATETIRFSINRHGSTYEYNDDLQNLIGSFVQSVGTDLKISEINPDPLVGELRVEITRDGHPIDDVKFSASPEINDDVAPGETGWYEYIYTIFADNFTEDGVYKITISSTDAAGNTPDSATHLGEIEFRVDTTKPEITSVVGLEDPIINAQEHEVTYTLYDTIGLKNVKIYVDGELVSEVSDFGSDMNNYTGTFVIGESTAVQHVEIVVEDMAGNVTSTADEDFTSAYEFNADVTVSTNLFVRFYANKPLFWGSIIGVVVIAGVIWFILAGKRKKEEE